MSLRKKIIIICVIILFALVAAAGIFLYNQSINKQNRDLAKVSDSEIISLLEKNFDAKDYMQNHPDFKIEKKEVLTKESITAGQSALNFREVYYDLELEENRYMKIDLMNLAGDKGMVAVIDFKNETVPKAYGILLFKATQEQNGQIPIPTENN